MRASKWLLLGLWPAVASGNALDHLRTTNDIGPNKVPHLGTSHILVIPTRVGLDEFPEDRWQELEAFYDPEGGPGTFRGYWQAVSGGRYDPIPTLAQPVMYAKRCPLPGKTVDDCKFDFGDLSGLRRDTLVSLYGGLLERVRDEQQIDLANFDVNTAEGPGQDGWFDGVIVDSDILDGVGIPLNAFGAAARVEMTPRAPRPDAAMPDPPDAAGPIEPDAAVPRDGAPPDAGALDAASLDGAAPRPAPDAAVVDAGAPDATPSDSVPPDSAPPDAALPVDAAPEPIPPGTIALGNVAMAPPNLHEYGHVLGFIDLYNGPSINDLMGPYLDEVTLSAFSRQQIGWGEVQAVEGPGTHDLVPVMDGGVILRLGTAPRYVLVEHRGGGQHALWDRSPPGSNIYSVDEETLPVRALGFLDLAAGDLYFPNDDPPYLNVNLPVGCELMPRGRARPCVAEVPGETRALEHAGGDKYGLHLRIDGLQPDGTMRVTFLEGDLEPPPEPDGGPPDVPRFDNKFDAAVGPPDAGPDTDADSAASSGGCGCHATGTAPVSFLLLALPFRRRRR